MKILYVFMAYGALGGIPTIALIEKSLFKTLKNTVKELRVFNHFAITKKLYPAFKEKHRELLRSDGNKFQILLGYAASEGLLRAVDGFRPDFILVVNGHLISPEVLNEIRKKGIKAVLWFMDDPYQSASGLGLAKDFDIVFTVDSAMLSYYRERGVKNIFHLPLAFDPEVFYPMEVPVAYLSDVNFLGSYFPNRIEIFEKLGRFLGDFNIRIIGDRKWKEHFSKDNPLQNKIEVKYVAHEEAARYYCGARINLNIHRASYDERCPSWNQLKIEGRTPNDRVFTISGCRAFQLVDDSRPDLGRYFEIGKEIITFEDSVDLKDKITYYLEHEDERKAIAEAAYRRAKREHTYEQRIKEMLDIVKGSN